MFLERKSTFWEVVVRKSTVLDKKTKTISVFRPHPCGVLPICALQRHTQSAMRVPHLNSPQCQIVSEYPWYLKLFNPAGHKIVFPIIIDCCLCVCYYFVGTWSPTPPRPHPTPTPNPTPSDLPTPSPTLTPTRPPFRPIL